MGLFYTRYTKQEAHLMLTNPRDAFRGRSRSPNMVSFDIWFLISVLYNFVPKMHRF